MLINFWAKISEEVDKINKQPLQRNRKGWSGLDDKQEKNMYKQTTMVYKKSSKK